MSDEETLTVEQLKAARALLSWDQATLAEKAGVGVATIKRIEVGQGLIKATSRIHEKIRLAAENAGIEFVKKGGALGVLLRAKSY